MNLKNVMRWLAIFVFTLNVNAQWKSSMNGIYVDSTKVGVGMIPNSRFSVEEHDSLNYGGSSLISTFARRFLANRVSFNIYGFPSSSQAKSHLNNSVMLFTGDARDMVFTANRQDGRIRFFTQDWQDANHERMVINSDGKVGIGGTPNSPFMVKEKNPDYNYNVNTIIASFNREYNGSNVALNIFGYPKSNLNYPHLNGAITMYTGGDAKDMVLISNRPDGRIRFFTQDWQKPEHERMVIDSIGRVGIGVTKPEAALQVAQGDVYISDIKSGVVMRSPDGRKWRGTLDNEGNLKFKLVDQVADSINSGIIDINAVGFNVKPGTTNGNYIADFEVDGNYLVQIFDILGKEIFSLNVTGRSCGFSLNSFPSGVYIVSVIKNQNQGIGTVKIVK